MSLSLLISHFIQEHIELSVDSFTVIVVDY